MSLRRFPPPKSAGSANREPNRELNCSGDLPANDRALCDRRPLQYMALTSGAERGSV